MVNTHRKFPVDARHNAFYAADGSDLREATREEIEKYRLAVAHKQRKPEVESSYEKSESATTTPPGGKVENTSARKDDDRGRKGYPSHNRESDHRKSSYDKDWKTGRTLSRDSTGCREASTRDSSKSEASRRSGNKDAGGRSADRDRKTGESADVEDDDERDRRKMEEILRRMEERKVAKEAEAMKKETGGVKGPTVVAEIKGPKERQPETEDKATAERMATDISRASKKVVPGKEKTVTAESKQREEARIWASGEVSDTAIVTQSTVEKVSSRQQGGKKAAEKKMTDSAEVATATYVQNFVAAQYPPMDEGVSSTVRLGRGFVSGALGWRTDDRNSSTLPSI